MEFLMYLLKSAACLAVLMLFYKLLLEKENMHVFKRFYLLIAVVISFVIPFITFTTYVEPLPQQTIQIVEASYGATGEISQQNINYWPLVFWIIYGSGVLFFSVIFIRNLRNLVLKIRRNPKEKNNQIINVLLQEEVPPHTFWNFIFLNKQKFEERSIPQEVFQHEQAHARQKHSIDILFIELLQIIFWFNPLIYFVKRAIKLNHEFLADRAVLTKGANITNYQYTLLAFSSNAMNSSLVNQINYSSIRRRFTVMKRKTSRRIIWIRSMLVLPLLAGLIYGFSTTEEVQKPIIETVITSDMVQEKATQKKATSEMLREYDSLVKHYNSFGDDAIIKQRDWDRMESIYTLLTPEQKKKVTQVKFKPVPPPIPAQWAKEKEATPEMMEEYNKLARQYSSQPQQTDKSRVYEYDFLRMNHIHSLMTDDQKANAEPLPDIDIFPSLQQIPEDATPNKESKESVPGDGNLVITEYIDVHILKDGNLLVNNKKINPNGLEKRLREINSYLSLKLQRSASVDVWVEHEVSLEQVQKVEDILRSHGMSKIRIIFKSLIDVPERDYPDYLKELEIRNPDGIFR